MKNSKLFLFFPVAVLVLALSVMTSCVTQKQVRYLQKVQKQDTTNIFSNTIGEDYKIKPKDNLYIKVFSLDEKTYSFFNKQGTNSYNDYASDASIYLNSYTVNNDGKIEFPIIGLVYVKDLTLEQIKDVFQKLIDEYLKETVVIVKLVNYKITLVGEVRNPGQYKIYQENVNLFEAFSLAGDLTSFADKSHVVLVRQTKSGSHVYYLNLNSITILNSEFYYLRPNDIIYIAPLGVKRWGFETFPWALIFSAISTALLLISYFKTF